MGRSADNRATSVGTGTGTGTSTKITTGSVQLSTHSASLGGAGGKAGRNHEYDGILQRWDDPSADIVPTKAWHRLKHFIDAAGLRMEFEADYRRENEALREKYGMPLRGAHVVAGYEREVMLFKRWHMRIHAVPPSRWPWQTPEEA